jgi:hypothetical protein
MSSENSALPETLTNSLLERVDKLVQANKRPLLSTTPTTDAIGELAARIDALEKAVRGHCRRSPEALSSAMGRSTFPGRRLPCFRHACILLRTIQASTLAARDGRIPDQ